MGRLPWRVAWIELSPGRLSMDCCVALAEAGSGLEHVVRTRMFLTSAADAEVVGAVHGELLALTRPAATMVVVADLLDPRWKVEIEAEATVG